jgi:hypothetical protein
MPFDENGIFRSGCVGTENGAMLIVFKRDADGTVKGMLYEAISQD